MSLTNKSIFAVAERLTSDASGSKRLGISDLDDIE